MFKMLLLVTGAICAATANAHACGREFLGSRLLARQILSTDPAVAQAACDALRAAGPTGLAAVIQQHAALLDPPAADQADGENARDDAVLRRLHLAIDRIGRQRDNHIARLYWYTDLEQAKTAAREQQKPILSLRLLGLLTDEYSCANSRFFRSTLYSNEQVGNLLREHFVLHWQSVRPVPRVTIDFGDGRKLQRTVTGNSVHYVLDARGRVVDALPGLFGPIAFLRLLTADGALAEQSQALDDNQLVEQIANHHRKELDSLRGAWQADLRRLNIPLTGNTALLALQAPANAQPVAQKASQRAVAKHIVERPLLGAALPALRSATAETIWPRIAELHQADAQLDQASVALIASQNPTATDAGELAFAKSSAESPLTRMIHNFQETIAVDSVRNEYRLHGQIHEWFVAQAAQDLDILNERVYAELFLTPSSDPWLGLVPADAYTGLDNNGLAACPISKE